MCVTLKEMLCSFRCPMMITPVDWYDCQKSNRNDDRHGLPKCWIKGNVCLYMWACDTNEKQDANKSKDKKPTPSRDPSCGPHWLRL